MCWIAQAREKLRKATSKQKITLRTYPVEPAYTGTSHFGNLPTALVHFSIAKFLEPQDQAALICTARRNVGVAASYRPIRWFLFQYQEDDAPYRHNCQVDVTKHRLSTELEVLQVRRYRWDYVSGCMQVVALLMPNWLHNGYERPKSISDVVLGHAKPLYDFAIQRRVPFPVMLNEIAAWKKQLKNRHTEESSDARRE